MVNPFLSTNREPSVLSEQESLFHLSNGYLGLRGCFAEHDGGYGAKNTVRGTYINGFYERLPLTYAEAHKGFPMEGERMVSLPDARCLAITIDEERLSPLSHKSHDFVRTLDPVLGQRSHKYIYRAGPRRTVSVEICELLSFVDKDTFAQKLTLAAGQEPVTVSISASLDGCIRNTKNEHDPRLAKDTVPLLKSLLFQVNEEVLSLQASTVCSCLDLAIAASLELEGADALPVYQLSDNDVSACYEITIPAHETITLTRYLVFADSRHEKEPIAAARTRVRFVHKRGFEALAEEQAGFLASFWQTHRVSVEGDEETSKALDFAVYSLLQSAASDGISLIPAKGLSGEGYEGHYFWDFEIYLFPFYLWTWPELAKKLLDYRLRILPKAKKNALTLGYKKGAQYAWRTITGPECSGYFPSGSAQVHINADIAHAFYMYWLVTADLAYMSDGGIDVLIETARTWLELGAYRDGRFMIFGVTGPDEYTCLVDNNYFTNRSAAANLLAAVRIADFLTANGHLEWKKRTGITDTELVAFQTAAKAMYLPHDDKLGIDAQDDGFLNRPEWDLASTPPEQFPLLLHYHPSKLYRYQVLKQPDTTLAHFLYEPDLRHERVRRSRHYYEARTTHDSSLSACIYGTVAARDGEMQKAWRYFKVTRDMDLKNLQGNTADGLHLGNLGGMWMFVTHGLAGLSMQNDTLSLDPRLPQHWSSLSFRIVVGGQGLDIAIDRTGSHLTWQASRPLDILYRGRPVSLLPGYNYCQHHLGLIFDLDGVLCHTDRYHYQAWKTIADREGISFTQGDNARLRGVSRMESLDILLEKARKQYSDDEKADMADAKNEIYRKLLAKLNKTDIARKHRIQLDRLQANYKLAIGSSSKNATYIVERLGLDDMFPSIADGRQIENSKPHPEVFLLAAKKLGLRPEDCAVIEDASAGLEAAVAGRFTAIGFAEAGGHRLAELSFNNLGTLLDWFDKKTKENNHG